MEYKRNRNSFIGSFKQTNNFASMSMQLSPEFMKHLNTYLSNFKNQEIKTFKYKCLHLQQVVPFPIAVMETWFSEIVEEIPKLKFVENYKTRESLIADYLILFFYFSKDDNLFNLIHDLVKYCLTPFEFLAPLRVAKFTEICFKHIPEQAKQVENLIEIYKENFKETRKKETSTEEPFSDIFLDLEVPEETTPWTPVQGGYDQDEQVMNHEMPSSSHDEGFIEVMDFSPLSEEKDALDRKYESFTNTPKQFIEAVKQVHFENNMKVRDLTLGSIDIKSDYFREDLQLKKLNDHFQVIKVEVFKNKLKEFKLFCEEFVEVDKENKGSHFCKYIHTINRKKNCCVTGCIAIASAKSLNHGNSGPFTRLPSRRRKKE
jgi:hypothetical protein